MLAEVSQVSMQKQQTLQVSSMAGWTTEGQEHMAWNGENNENGPQDPRFGLMSLFPLGSGHDCLRALVAIRVDNVVWILGVAGVLADADGTV